MTGIAQRPFLARNDKKGAQLLHIESGAAPVVAASLSPRGCGRCASWGWRGEKIATQKPPPQGSRSARFRPVTTKMWYNCYISCPGAACVIPASRPPRDSGPCGSWGRRGVNITARKTPPQGSCNARFWPEMDKKVAQLLHIESGAAPVVAASLSPRGCGRCGSWGWCGVKIIT